MNEMRFKNLSTFSDPAAKLWAAIPIDARKKLLAKVWCSNCGHGVAITNFSGEVKAGDLPAILNSKPIS